MFNDRISGESASTADSKEKLLGSDDDVHWQSDTFNRRSQNRSSRRLWIFHGIIEAALILIIAYLTLKHTSKPQCRQMLYSPAQDAIEYEVVKFNAGYLPGEKSIYQLDGPTPTDSTDQTWTDLYKDWMWSKIPREQAAQLVNRTINIPGEEDHYLIGLDVFHQLHCLDNVRKGLWPQRYKPEDYMGGKGMSLLSDIHLDHCIDQIRQSLMCNSDVSTNWLFWDEATQTNTAAGSTHHSCRRFDKVVEWARDHKAEPFDLKIRLEDPLQNDLV